MGSLKKIEKNIVLDRILGSAIIIRPSAKLTNWLIENQGAMAQLLTTQRKSKLTVEELQQDVRVYVVTENDEVDAAADLLKHKCQEIFEDYLNTWCPIKSLWPKSRDLQSFAENFEIQ